jgi:hypothetical protein
VITARATTLADLAVGRLDLDAALSEERVTLAGDHAAARRLLASISGARAPIT